MRELRCSGNKLHGLVVDDGEEPHGIVEFRCDSKFCGKASGNVVLHRFDLGTGVVETRMYLEPTQPAERGPNGVGDQPTAVRDEGRQAEADRRSRVGRELGGSARIPNVELQRG